ncbi:hypothetical protein [Formicincola oecophyllae]|uniref:hypothetical protein n=1 Tax=Formicincola oecophyllae TaxID=2558361 RepID=UPI0019D1637A|nr:hypothetical protein [Formicincola oecophyllae]
MLNWETAVQKAFARRQDNLLLEFTATVDYKNPNILEKYKSKIIQRYDFKAFNQDGYSKVVRPLYNEATQAIDQKRALIVHAVALSQYRKLLAASLGVVLNPVILVKSTKVKQSEEDRNFFNAVIQSITPEDFRPLLKLGDSLRSALSKAEASSTTSSQGHQEDLTIAQMFTWLADAKRRGALAGPRDPDGLQHFIASIKEDFSPESTLVYNSQKKDNPTLLKKLDDPRNTIRTIFSVQALNEGWDVLSLFDIIHFDIASTKKVSLQDVQLIGRGARLFPYELPRKYDNAGMFSQDFGTDRYKRKFDRSPQAHERILETMFYHFVKTGAYWEGLKEDLLGEGIINRGSVKITLKLKEHFQKSETYRKGFVLLNKRVQRTEVTERELDAFLQKPLEVRPYELRSESLHDRQRAQAMEALETKKIKLTEEFFSRTLLRSALMVAEGDFFRHENLARHLPGLESVDVFLTRHLPRFEIIYRHHPNKSFEGLSAQEKHHLLVHAVLPQIRKAMDREMPLMMGSRTFYPVPMEKVFSKVKDIWLVADDGATGPQGEKLPFSSTERARSQINHFDDELRCDLSRESWYAHNDNYGTLEEKRFVKYIQNHITKLQSRFKGCEIFLLRNELEYFVYSLKDGRRFAPDYLLFINDRVNRQFYFQCLLEAKGEHLWEHDSWKQEALLNITHNAEVDLTAPPGGVEVHGKSFVASADFLLTVRAEHYETIKCLGVAFYNAEPEKEQAFQTSLGTTLGL